jgi:hypothetical protein
VTRVVAIVPARNEEARVGDTVAALEPLADEVVVVDDGSEDATTPRALAAGATVLRIPARAGKGAAIEGALRRLPPADVWLLADADLGASAAGLRTLLDHVLGGGADLAIAVLPRQPGGGFGIVKRLAGRAIRALAGLRVREPLSGQRAVTAPCLAACRPLARGFGLETAMTIDAVRAGYRVEEVEVDGLGHRPTGRGLGGFAHRARQGMDIARAVLGRVVRLG